MDDDVRLEIVKSGCVLEGNVDELMDQDREGSFAKDGERYDG